MVLKEIGLTGSSGMLGRHLRAALEAVGANVIKVSRSGAEGSAVWDLVDWLDSDSFDRLFPGVQAVVHAGALVQSSGDVNEEQMFNSNVRACLNLGQWARSRNVPLVYVSGAIVYADPNASLQRESAPLGWSGFGGFYGLSKLLAEEALTHLRRQGLKLCVVRPTSIYGYGISSEKAVSRFLATASSGNTIELRQPVDDQVDLVHAADVSEAIVAALTSECWDTFNVSSGTPVSLLEIAEACIAVSGSGRLNIVGERPLGYVPLVRYSLDTRHAKECIDWQSRIDLRTGLNLLLDRQYLLNA